MKPVTAFLTLASVVVGLTRALGFHSGAYQALAHLWVGALVGCWALAWAAALGEHLETVFREKAELALNRYLPLWVGLSLLEVACFLIYGRQG